MNPQLISIAAHWWMELLWRENIFGFHFVDRIYCLFFLHCVLVWAIRPFTVSHLLWIYVCIGLSLPWIPCIHIQLIRLATLAVCAWFCVFSTGCPPEQVQTIGVDKSLRIEIIDFISPSDNSLKSIQKSSRKHWLKVLSIIRPPTDNLRSQTPCIISYYLLIH